MEPEKIGRYEIQGVLGQGAMGLVYKAFDPRLERQAAIKVMSGQVDEELLTRFFHEARSAAKLNHPNIISVYDLGEGEEQPFIAMEYLEGEDLKEINQKAEPVSFVQKLDWVIQICEALDFAHRHGIVHRDIKPGNVFVTKNKGLKILDFGLARLSSSEVTKSGVLMGSPYYMSPEQVTGKRDIDGRSDLFSVGVMLYELVCSKRPFEGESITSVCFQIISEPHPPLSQMFPGCSPELIKIMDRSLAKDRDQRYQHGSEMAEELRHFRDQLNAVQDSLKRSITTLEKRLAYLVERSLLTREQERAAWIEAKGDPEDYSHLLRYHASLKQAERAGNPQTPAVEQVIEAAAEGDATQMLEARTLDVLAPSPPVKLKRTAAATAPSPWVPSKSPAKGRLVGLIGAAVILAVLAGAALWWSGGLLSLGGGSSLVLDVAPWARIESITEMGSGRSIPLEEGLTTPCVVPLAPGRYQVTASNPHFGGPFEFEVSIAPGETSVVHQTMPEFDLEEEVTAAVMARP